MGAYRELAGEVCGPLTMAQVACKTRRWADAIDLANRAVLLINTATSEVDSRLKAISHRLRVRALAGSPRILCVDDNQDAADSAVELFRMSVSMPVLVTAVLPRSQKRSLTIKPVDPQTLLYLVDHLPSPGM